MAPTRLGQVGQRYFRSQGGQEMASPPAEQPPAVTWMVPPWPGYEPDVDPAAATPGAALLCSNVVDRNGTLTLDDGYARIDAADLPLDSGNAIVGLPTGYNRNAAYPGPLRKLALTTTKLYELNSGAWVARAYTNTTAGSAAVSTTAGALADYCYFPPGDYVVICTGPDVSDVYRYPDTPGGTHYTELYNIGAFVNFRAKSVCAYEDRLHYLNTFEDGLHFPNRLRWTSKGAAATIDETVTGATFADFTEFSGNGLRVLPIGQKIAVYFEDGLQFIVRTGRATDPYQRDYGTHDRGLLSTRSLVSVGSAIHFGIFTDGWYLVTADGNWTELGTIAGKNGSTYYKWKHTFYESLNWQQKSLVSVEYDPIGHTVLISFPTGSSSSPNALWRYDLTSDRCYPRTEVNYPNVLGRYIEDATTGITWAAATFAWSSASALTSWGSESGIRGADRIAMGTPNGVVYQFQGAQVSKLRDGVDANWSYQSHFYDGGLPHLHKRNDRIYATYTHSTTALVPQPIALGVASNVGGSTTGAISTAKGDPGTRQTDFVSGTLSGQQFQFVLSGTGDVAIQRVGLELSTEDTKVLRQEVSG